MTEDKQPILLLIETATEVCSVALVSGEKILASKETSDGNSHSRNLIPFIDEVIRKSDMDIHQLDGVGLSIGPGSYTGLRIGASTAKGLCYALDIPLVALSTLQNIMMGVKEKMVLPATGNELPLLYCPMIDARRMEVYTAFFDESGEMQGEVSAVVVDDDHSFADVLKSHRVVFCGNGMNKCRSILERHENVLFSDIPLSAVNMKSKATGKFSAGMFEDVAYFEPFYLKEYVAVKSGVKGLQ